jgi:hypothetical protein
MAFSVSHVIGADLNNPVPVSFSFTNGSTAVVIPNCGPLGMEVFGSDGKLYVLGQANASIPASTTACTVNATTFLVTASGGSYTSPATALVSGDVAWFSKASV